MITLYSFGIKRGSDKATDAEMVIDCTILVNPHHNPTLRPLDGRDMKVKEAVARDPDYARLLRIGYDGVVQKKYTRIAFSCFGGRHRSVAMAEMLADYLRDEGYEVELQHLALKDRKEASGANSFVSH